MNEQEVGEKFAEVISSFLNTFSQERQKVAVQKMLRDHRSLQQSTMRFFMVFVEGMAANSHDLRNEAAVELAQAIMALPERVRTLPKV